MYNFFQLSLLVSLLPLVRGNYEGPTIQYASQVVVNRTVYLIQGYRIDASTQEKKVLDQLLTLDTYKDFKATDSPFVENAMDEVLNQVESLACAQLKPDDLGFQCFGGRAYPVSAVKPKGPSSRYDGDKKTWSPVSYNGDKEPAIRYGHKMVTLPDGGILMVGGADPKTSKLISNDEMTWYLDSQLTWKSIKSTYLDPVYYHTLSVVPKEEGKPGKVVLIGGKLSEGKDKLVDGGIVYVYDMGDQSWKKTKVTYGIKSRHSHSAVVRGRKVIVFGGTDADGNLLSDVVQLDVDTLTYETLSAPSNTQGRSGHTAALFKQFMLVFFGETKDLQAKSLVFDLDKQTWTNNFAANQIIDNKQTTGSTNLGAIIGGAVGGVVFLILVAAAFWYWRRKSIANFNASQQSSHQMGSGSGEPLHEPNLDLEIDSGLDNFSTNIYSDGGSNYPSNLNSTRYNSNTNFNTMNSFNETKP